MIKDYYKILGVSPNSTKKEVKRAFRKLALKFHPDKNKQVGAHDIFVEIIEANLILSDEEARRKYDLEYENFYSYQYRFDVSKQDKEFVRFEDEDLRRWANSARGQGEEYAKIPFLKFAEMVKNISVDVAVVGSKAFAYAFGGIFGFSSFFTTIAGVISGNISLIFMGVISGILAYYLSQYSNYA